MYRFLGCRSMSVPPVVAYPTRGTLHFRLKQNTNEVRLHSAIGYITPADKLAGQAEEIFAARDRKLEAARRLRAESRQRRRA
jgi:hypothetical protein